MPVSKTYNYTTFDDPIGANGTNGTYGEGSNASGKIVGYYYDSSGNAHGFLKTDGSYITLDFGNNDQTFAQGINASGQIVGWYNDLNSDHAFLYGGGSFTTLKDLGTVNTFAEGINASGQIVG